MTFRHVVIPMAFAAALAAGATPASAQHGGGGHMAGGHMGGGPSRGGQQGAGHMGSAARPAPGQGRGHEQFEHRGDEQFEHRGFGPRVGGPFAHVGVIRPFHGPFYAFRPRFNLGFGLFLGYPVPYPWDYVAAYPYDVDPYDYPYDVDPYGSTYSDPNDSSSIPLDEQRSYGGISLGITPGDASVSVDGIYVGPAENFSPSAAPLTLAPGKHHVVIEKPGYQSMTFDSDVSVGQVNPYQGAMQPQ